MSGDSESIKVVIDADRMAASVIMPPGLDPILAAAPAVLSALEERGVSRTQDCVREVEALVRSYASTAEVRAVVARGRPPTQGTHGWIKLAEKFLVESSENAAPTNHYERTSYVTVAAGEVIGRLFPPVEGADGMDVTGRTLACKAVRPSDISFDDTIKQELDGSLVATRPGILLRSERRLQISDTLELPEYVDFSTGNIDFPGNVRVARGVRDCFIVRCDGSLCVHGLVEAATLNAGTDMSLEAGMAGREKGALVVGRDLTSKYLEGVQASIGRDAVVLKEITNSKLRVGRNLISPGLTVMGGSIEARGLVEVAEIGSTARIATEIVIGHDFEIEATLTKGLSVRDVLVARTEELKAKIQTLRKASGKKNATAAEEVTMLQLDLDIANSKLAALRQGLSRTFETLESVANGRLRVLGRIHPGAKVWIGPYMVEPRDEIAGLLVFSLTERGTIVISRDGQDANSSFRISREQRFSDRAAIRTKLAA